VTVTRTHTTRTATVSACPTGCWLILGEGLNDGWSATAAGKDLGSPQQISGGFNGWRLPPSNAPVTVKMTWTPQRTMWIGMLLAGLVVLGCIVLVWRDRDRSTVPEVAAPVADWPPRQTGRGRAAVCATAMVLLALLVISPIYAVLAGLIGAVVVVLRRPSIAAMTSVALISGLGALIVRRELRYRLVANPSWPAAFDNLHRLGLLVVVLLLAATIVDDGAEGYPDDQAEQLS
jgi:hypothetical protein